MHARGGSLWLKCEKCEFIGVSPGLADALCHVQSSITCYLWCGERSWAWVSQWSCLCSLFSSRRCQLAKILFFFEGMHWLFELKVQNTSWPNVELWNKPRKPTKINVVGRLFFSLWRNLNLNTCWVWPRPGVCLFIPPPRRSDHLSGYSNLHVMIYKIFGIFFLPLHKGAFYKISLSGKGGTVTQQLPLEIFLLRH